MIFRIFIDSEEIEVEENVDEKEFYNDCLSECVQMDEESSFEQIFYLISDENMPVDFKHSVTTRTALSIAAEKGYPDVILKLLSYGANPKQCDSSGRTAIDYATENEHEECAQILYLSMDSFDLKASIPASIDAEVKSSTDIYQDALRQFTLAAYQLTSSQKNDIDHELLYSLISHLHETKSTDGSILVFLPGYEDIMQQKQMIEERRQFVDFELFVLHSGVNGTNSAEQSGVFDRLPRGLRKVILSTNIAETSLTIDDVVYVIDAGKVKQQTYDSVNGTTCLHAIQISKACAKQRSGRAGRIQNGFCYRMYSTEQYEAMDQYTLPEILRVPLTEICLNAKILAADKVSIQEFLLKALQPPSVRNIQQSISLLQQIDALDENENITYLGIHLANMPVDSQLGKAILYAVVMKCLDPVVIIVSALSVKDPFLLPLGDEAARIVGLKKAFAGDSLSDHKMLLNSYNVWFQNYRNKSHWKFCRENMICNGNMEMIHGIKNLILGHLRMAGIICEGTPRNIQKMNENSNKWEIIKACLTAGIYPNVCLVGAIDGKIYSKQDSKLIPHMSSTLRERKARFQLDPKVMSSGVEWIIHGEKSRLGAYPLIRNITCVPSIDVVLFTGPIKLQCSFEVINHSAENAKSQNVDDEDDEDEEDEEEYEDDLDIDLMGYGMDDKLEFDDDCETILKIDEWISFTLDKTEAELLYALRKKFAAIFIKFLKNPYAFSVTNKELLTVNTIVDVIEKEDYVEQNLKTLQAQASNENQSNITQFDQIRMNILQPNDSLGAASLPVFESSTYANALLPNHKRNKKNKNKNSYDNKDFKSVLKENFFDSKPRRHNGAFSKSMSSGLNQSENITQSQIFDPSVQPSTSSLRASTSQLNSRIEIEKYFILRIKNVDRLIETVSSQRWQFQTSWKHLRKNITLNREACVKLYAFFYVIDQKAIVGGGTLSTNYGKYDIAIDLPKGRNRQSNWRNKEQFPFIKIK